MPKKGAAGEAASMSQLPQDRTEGLAAWRDNPWIVGVGAAVIAGVILYYLLPWLWGAIFG